MADTQAKRDIRRERLRIALDTAVEGETIKLDELAKVWGVGKPAFVNVRDRIDHFPAATIDGKTHFYPRLKALQSLDRWERREDANNADKNNRIAQLIGVESAGAATMSLSDLTKASALRAEMEERMRAQGQLVAFAKLQTTAGKVFELLSRGLSNMGTVMDPNGAWSSDDRERADKHGRALLLRLHGEMKDMLGPDADRTTRPDGDGAVAPGPDTARPSRRPSGGVA